MHGSVLRFNTVFYNHYHPFDENHDNCLIIEKMLKYDFNIFIFRGFL